MVVNILSVKVLYSPRASAPLKISDSYLGNGVVFIDMFCCCNDQRRLCSSKITNSKLRLQETIYHQLVQICIRPVTLKKLHI